MLAPVRGPPIRASNATVRPTASPATGPSTRESVATAMTTRTRKKVSTVSTPSPGEDAEGGRGDPGAGRVSQEHPQEKSWRPRRARQLSRDIRHHIATRKAPG